MNIIIDAMGGDNAPQAVVQGALEAHAQCGADIVLVGREEDIRACLTGPLPEGVEMVQPGDHATFGVELIQPIAMEEGLTFAVREGGHTVGSGRVTKIIE